jgi:hypothetical protein
MTRTRTASSWPPLGSSFAGIPPSGSIVLTTVLRQGSLPFRGGERKGLHHTTSCPPLASKTAFKNCVQFWIEMTNCFRTIGVLVCAWYPYKQREPLSIAPSGPEQPCVKHGRKSNMSIPHSDSPKQRRKSQTASARTTHARQAVVPPAPDNDHEVVSRLHADRPTCCPTCETPLRFFPLHASALLDWVEILDEDLTMLHHHLHDLKRSIESSVLP